MEYDVINLGNTGNERDGFQMDSAHFTAQQIVLEHPTLANALNALKRRGMLSEAANTTNVYIHEHEIGTDSQTLTLRERNGRWLYELRPLK